MQKTVTVIMPAYNSAKTIARSISSVISQTYVKWRLIIIDDASHDATPNVVSKFLPDKRITYVRNDINLGVAKSRNRGLEMVESGYIAFLDSDDVWIDEKLEVQVELAKAFPSHLIHCYYDVLNNNGAFIRRKFAPKFGDYNRLLYANYIGTSTVLFESQNLENARFAAVGHEDYAFWLDLLQNNVKGSVCVEKPLVKYYLTDSSLSHNKVKAALWTFRIYMNRPELSKIKGLKYFISYAISSLRSRVQR